VIKEAEVKIGCLVVRGNLDHRPVLPDRFCDLAIEGIELPEFEVGAKISRMLCQVLDEFLPSTGPLLLEHPQQPLLLPLFLGGRVNWRRPRGDKEDQSNQSENPEKSSSRIVNDPHGRWDSAMW
jgi:hypothetical protein